MKISPKNVYFTHKSKYSIRNFTLYAMCLSVIKRTEI